MNKQIIVLCSVLLVLFAKSYGQNKELLLRNKVTGKEIAIHEGSRLKIVCNDGKVLRGRLIFNDTFKSDNEIKIIHHFGNNLDRIYNVNLTDIKFIKPKPLYRPIVGSTFLGIGVGLFITMIISDNDADNQMNAIQKQGGDIGAQPLAVLISDAFLFAAGTVVTIVGVVVLTGGTKYNNENWKYSVKTL